ncbi:MAG: diaminopimelate epimerase [Woeseiaceae bacterium]|nr:diaminopimelate epimerase [Woeseiaceae bacterium]
MLLPYLKMQGAGNQIVVVDRRADAHPPPPPEVIRTLGHGGTGPGFDQLMWVGPATDPAAIASYRVFNRDGSEVQQCGNGVRCVAWMLARDDAVGSAMLLEGPAGSVEAVVQEDGLISVNMGAPELEPGRIPFAADAKSDRYELEVGGRTHQVSAVSMGNPHCVLLVDSIAAADVDRLGPAIEEHPRFPEATNVGFMCIVDRANIELRVWERGVGETLACGTGACAAVVAGRLLDLLDEQVSVKLPGGQLVVSWHGAAEPVWLTGNAELISEGTIDL